MAEGKGEITGPGDQQLYRRVNVTEAEAGHKGFQNQIAA